MTPPFKPSLYTSNLDPECTAKLEDEPVPVEDSWLYTTVLDNSCKDSVILPDVYYEAPSSFGKYYNITPKGSRNSLEG